jgi:hypothetical protein
MAQITLNSSGVASNGTLALQSNGTTTAVTIDTSQRLHIGNTSGSSKLTVTDSGGGVVANFTNTSSADFGINLTAGVALLTPTTGTLAFGTSSTERGRFDSSGNFLVGTTDSSPTTGAGVKIIKDRAGLSSYNSLSIFSTANSTGYSTYELYTSTSGTGYKFYVVYNGGVANYQANDSNLSDRREKTNFAPAGNYLEKICAIPVQTFTYINQDLEQDPDITLGVIAQDVQEVAPELVTETKLGTGAEGETRLAIYQTDFQYALMKCIQEQQTIIESLTTRITALEGQ